MKMYMHTLDGKPASYSEKYKLIYFCSSRGAVKLVGSLSELRKQQTRDWDACIAKSLHVFEYGYVRVNIPEVSE